MRLWSSFSMLDGAREGEGGGRMYRGVLGEEEGGRVNTTENGGR